jgi:hypothetical protein
MIKKNSLILFITAVVLFTLIFSVNLRELSAQPAKPGKIDINKEWSKFISEVTKDARLHGKKHFTAILFDENLEPIHANRYTAISGELIYVGVLKEEEEVDHYFSLDFHPCSLESNSPSLLVRQTNPVKKPVQGEIDEVIGEAAGDTVEKFPPGSCLNQHVTLTVKKTMIGSDGKEKVVARGQFVLEQYKRYRATLQLGILFSRLNNEQYGLMSKQGKNIIYSKGPDGRAPQYNLSVIIYGIPHYIGSLFSSKHLYNGRDILHDRSFFDRIGAVVGTGLKNRMGRFVIGFSFEVIYGVNLMGVWEFARLNELAGDLNLGDAFTGTEAEIPLNSRWRSKFVVGISFDFRYISRIMNTGIK